MPEGPIARTIGLSQYRSGRLGPNRGPVYGHVDRLGLERQDLRAGSRPAMERRIPAEPEAELQRVSTVLRAIGAVGTAGLRQIAGTSHAVARDRQRNAGPLL